MVTTNDLNISQSGIPIYNSATGAFANTQPPEDQVLVGGANSTILGIDPTGSAVGNPLCSTGAGTPPSYSQTPVCTSITIQNPPSNPSDGTNKAYVDLIAGSFSFLDSTIAASTTNLIANYSNGASGVGATLTNSGALVAFELDGYSLAATNRVLIKNQTNAYENGVYVVNVVGDPSTPWELERAADYDQPSEITPGSVVSVLYGNTQSDTFWAQTQNITNIGTDDIVYIQFAAAPTGVLYAANNLSDVASVPTSRANLGLTNIATQNVTQYSVLAGDASDAILSLPSGATGQVLTSQGPGTLPIWASNGGGGTGFSSINVQVFTASGTYTPSPNMLYAQVEVVGGGGGGGGTPAGNNDNFGGGGGGSGAYARKIFNATTLGSSQSVIIGDGGGGVLGGSGGQGAPSSFGSFITCTGGLGGIASYFGVGGNGGTATGGDLNVSGSAGITGTIEVTGNYASTSGGGAGAASYFGGSAKGSSASSSQGNQTVSNGVSASINGYGSGGGGACASGFISFPPGIGGNGAPGVCIITEYIGNNASPPSYSYTLVTSAMSPYTVTSTDMYLGVDTTSGPVTINLQNADVVARNFTIKDKVGNASVNNITVTTPGASTLIDGSTSYVISGNYQSINLIYNGSAYEVF